MESRENCPAGLDATPRPSLSRSHGIANIAEHGEISERQGSLSKLGLVSCCLLHFCRATSNLGIAGLELNVVLLRVTGRGLPTKADRLWQQFCSPLMQSVVEKVIFIVSFYFTCEAFQTQGVSWLESWELVLGLFFWFLL